MRSGVLSWIRLDSVVAFLLCFDRGDSRLNMGKGSGGKGRIRALRAQLGTTRLLVEAKERRCKG